MTIGFSNSGILTSGNLFTMAADHASPLHFFRVLHSDLSLCILKHDYQNDRHKDNCNYGAVLYIAMIIFFAYFYTSITFNPMEIANNMKKQGGFIPGIRPGRPTTEYLNKVLNYIIFVGAVGLTIVAIIPIFFAGAFGARVNFGGTSLIIVVGVVLETLKEV